MEREPGEGVGRGTAARSARGGALPHAYPFRFVDRGIRPEGGVEVLVSVNAAHLRGSPELSAFLAVEVLAQASLLALAAKGESTPGAQIGLLAGLESMSVPGRLRAGDRAVARASVVGRLGALIKVHAELRRDDQTIAEGELLVALRSLGS